MEKILKRLLTIMIFAITLISTLNFKTINSFAETKINNKEDIKEFIDNYFNEKMEKYNVPGAAVAVIKDNEEIFKCGYGYSDVEDRKNVDADKTTFALASCSKLFTAISIMQLYEQGRIDLDANIEEYIAPYKINNKYDKAVTCRNLLTHSSGLDESSEFNSKTMYKDKIKSQEYYMESHTPTVVKEPDTVCRYSNEGYNLLGYIVERVSNISYEEYVKKNILDVLNMKNSSVRLYDDNLAKGYLYDEDKYSEFPLLYQYTSGSAGVIATVSDVENFMKAILNNGVFKNNTILKKETLSMMKEKQFCNDKIFLGMGFGFSRSYRNKVQVIKHEGALPGYTSTLFFIPQENLGICVLTNSLSALPFNFEEEFLNYFYPLSNDEYLRDKEKRANNDLSKYEGTYRSYDGVSVNTIMKIGGIFEDMNIKDNKDGTLTLEECTTEKENITTTLVPCEDNTFFREDNKGKIAFRCDKEGNVTYAFNDTSFNSFEKIKLYERCDVSIIIFLSLIADFIISIFILVKSKVKKINIKLNLLKDFMFIAGTLGAITLIQLMSYNNDYCSTFWIYLSLTLLVLGAIILIVKTVLDIYLVIKENVGVKIIAYYFLSFIINLSFVGLLSYYNLLTYKIS